MTLRHLFLFAWVAACLLAAAVLAEQPPGVVTVGGVALCLAGGIVMALHMRST